MLATRPTPPRRLDAPRAFALAFALALAVGLAAPVARAQATASAPPAATPAPYGPALPAAVINSADIAEASGLAASRQHPGVLWLHNDGDNPAALVAVDTASGAVRGVLAIEGVRNVDWEDMAAFERDGRHYLAIADAGDNGGIRRDLAIHVVEEPATLAAAMAAPVAWTTTFTWPDGARDCEAMAVDAAAGTFLLASKKRVPPELFAVPIDPAADGAAHVASALGTFAGIAQPGAEDLARNPVYGRYRSQLTALDLHPDGLQLLALNYRTALLWTRAPGESWGEAIARPGVELPFAWLPQAEAAGFAADGDAVWITTERRPTPLLRLARRGGQAP
jgi:hypothetical protein